MNVIIRDVAPVFGKEGKMYCLSINYKNAGVEIRKNFAFPGDIQEKILCRLTCLEGIPQCVILCTCNRTELYFCGRESDVDSVVNVLAEYGHVSSDELLKNLLFYYDDKAVQHLFMVASGIESMVIGEDEILGQTKNAYLFAKERGAVGYDLNVIFQAAIACAKKIKTETLLSKTSVSTATIAASTAARIGDNVNALVIGSSGKIGSTVVKNLASYKNIRITVTQRVHKADFGYKYHNVAEVIDYNNRYDYIRKADCIISATSGPHYTVTKYDLDSRGINVRGKIFIDLAVPPDIDKALASLSEVEVIDIDYFKEIALKNNMLKKDGVEAAKGIIEEEIDTLKKDLAFHDFLPYMPGVKKSIQTVPLEEIIYKMKADTPAGVFEEVLKVYKELGRQVK